MGRNPSVMSVSARQCQAVALRRIRDERKRQVYGEGFTPDRDDGQNRRELAWAAIHTLLDYCESLDSDRAPMWPWPMREPSRKEGERALEIAGALVLAELERVERARVLAEASEPPLPF